MIVNIKKLQEDAVVPFSATEYSAGKDLTAVSKTYDAEHDCYVYGTGLTIEIPKGYVGLIFPRSSNRKTNFYMCNHVGVIDSDYRGEIMLSFKNRTSNFIINIINSLLNTLKINTKFGEDFGVYNVNDRIGQLIIIPYPKIEFVEVNELSETQRGANGHGSTGR